MPQRKHRPLPQFSEKQIQKFWEKVDRRGPDECWPWTARTFTTHTNRADERYGQFASFIASRVAFFLVTGIDPGELIVRHACDNPLCCNRNHLLLGTYTDNGRDRRLRGPRVKELRSWPETSRKNGELQATPADHVPHITYRPLPILNEKGRENFFRKVQRRGPDECWLWTGHIYKRSGYGSLCVNYRPWQAHRMAYFLHYGVDPGRALVCHSCDTRACCNPAHLSLGTPLKNQTERWERNSKPVSGEFSNRAILNWKKVHEIRSKYATGDYFYWELAQEYGVSLGCIKNVVTRENWH